MDVYDPEACVDEFSYESKNNIINKDDDPTLMYVFVSIIVLTTFVFVYINDQEDIKNLRDFCLSNL
jgi:hypothetical protein